MHFVCVVGDMIVGQLEKCALDQRLTVVQPLQSLTYRTLLPKTASYFLPTRKEITLGILLAAQGRILLHGH